MRRKLYELRINTWYFICTLVVVPSMLYIRCPDAPLPDFVLEYFYSSSSLPIDRCSLCSQRVLYFLLVLLILLQQQHTAAAAVTAVVPFKIYFLLIFIAANRGRRVNKQNNYHNREYENTRKFFLAVRQYEKNKNNSKSGQITQGGREGGVT